MKWTRNAIFNSRVRFLFQLTVKRSLWHGVHLCSNPKQSHVSRACTETASHFKAVSGRSRKSIFAATLSLRSFFSCSNIYLTLTMTILSCFSHRLSPAEEVGGAVSLTSNRHSSSVNTSHFWRRKKVGDPCLAHQSVRTLISSGSSTSFVHESRLASKMWAETDVVHCFNNNNNNSKAPPKSHRVNKIRLQWQYCYRGRSAFDCNEQVPPGV